MRFYGLLILALGLVSAATLSTPAYATHKKASHVHAAAKVAYVCPKCGVMSDKAGKCSSCKVALVKTTASAAYECAMCDVKSAKAGKCPKCGMAMTKISAKSHKL